MAINSNTSNKIAALGKRVISQISSRSSSTPLISRRSVHASVYDKNVEDHVQAAVVPDNIIQPQSDKYWSPNPQTGVFGPADPDASGERGFHIYAGNGGSESVLEQKTFFRPQEDLDKPEQA